ncbi:MAG: 30S ribosomal protein S17 [Candidatus Aenigmatarchaeota archaeon]
MSPHTKDIGIDGISPPTNVCNEKKCPWHGEIRIHGFLFEGKVIKFKHKIAKIEMYRYVYIPKYERYEKRRSTIKAYVPECLSEIKEGDVVIIGETRPLSKTVNFVVLGKK